MAYYDDPGFAYDQFWVGRQYEHHSEMLALEKLLGRRKAGTGVDVGGGFGRVTRWLARRCRRVYLVEPAAKMRQAAKKFLRFTSNVVIRSGAAADTNLPPKCADVVVMVRVIHHLPQPMAAIAEMKRIIKPRGLLVLEFANSAHFPARVRSWLAGRPILPVAVERRSLANIAAATIPFVNHHPVTIQKLLARQGFKVMQILSVSNLRSPWLKSLIPLPILLILESIFQSLFSSLYFGPSIFILARKL